MIGGWEWEPLMICMYVYDMCIYVYVDMYLYDLHDLDYMMFLSLLQTFR